MIARRWIVPLVAVVSIVEGCSSNSSTAPQPSLAAVTTVVATAAVVTTVAVATAIPVGATCTVTEFGGARPVTLHVPASYSCERPAPLIVALHGYSASGADIDRYFGLTAESDRRGFLLATPDGVKDRTEKPFWNATKACCNFGKVTTDDSAYLSQLVTDISSSFNVDAKRVFFVGHSNGGFMSYRMACEHSDQVAAIASLAGAMVDDVSTCTPKASVSVLQIHGRADDSILFGGGTIGSEPYPGALESVGDWATIDKCPAAPTATAKTLDLDSATAGAETSVLAATKCANGTAVELWVISDGTHSPKLTPDFPKAVVDFLYGHPKQ